MDDETYVSIDTNQVSCKEYFHAVDKKSAPDKVRFKSKQMFTKPYLVWSSKDQMVMLANPMFLKGVSMDTSIRGMFEEKTIVFH